MTKDMTDGLHNGDERPNDTGWEIYLDGKWYAYSENGEVTVPISFIHGCLRESFTCWKFYKIMKNVEEIKEIITKDQKIDPSAHTIKQK